MEIFASPRLEEVVVHDLRTPLNVINLALRMLDATALERSPELSEDLAMIRLNAADLERMLTYLVEISRLPNSSWGLAPQWFDPIRLIEDVAAEHRSRPGSPLIEVVSRTSPAEVQLDQARARMAIVKALANAAAASGGKPVRIRLGGAPDRLVIRFEVEVPPRESVQSHVIEPEQFQRVLGTPGERRGLDLAIAAKISTLFGGEARLEATPGHGTAVILDWPNTSPALV